MPPLFLCYKILGQCYRELKYSVRNLSNRIIISHAGNTWMETPNVSYVANHCNKLVGDSAIIEGIINSNHTIESIYSGLLPLSPRARKRLKSNHMPDKNKVIQNKIMRYYFLGNFDSAQFVRMPILVIAKVLSRKRNEQPKYSYLQPVEKHS